MSNNYFVNKISFLYNTYNDFQIDNIINLGIIDYQILITIHDFNFMDTCSKDAISSKINSMMHFF